MIYRCCSEEYCVDDEWEYTVTKDGTVFILKYLCQDATNVVIPDNLDGKTVFAIGYNAFADNRALSKIVIPDSVVMICDG
jgi:hypothetical protein